MKLGWCVGYGRPPHGDCRRSVKLKGETRYCQCDDAKCECSKNPREVVAE